MTPTASRLSSLSLASTPLQQQRQLMRRTHFTITANLITHSILRNRALRGVDITKVEFIAEEADERPTWWSKSKKDLYLLFYIARDTGKSREEGRRATHYLRDLLLWSPCNAQRMKGEVPRGSTGLNHSLRVWFKMSEGTLFFASIFFFSGLSLHLLREG